MRCLRTERERVTFGKVCYECFAVVTVQLRPRSIYGLYRMLMGLRALKGCRKLHCRLP